MNINQCNLNDSSVWDMICEGNVKGCFQIESHLGKTWCKKIKPRNINELSALISAIRPGVLKAMLDGKSMTQHLADRKNGLEEVKYPDDSIADILKETYGVILYQEQAMQIAVKMASFDLKQADDLRKAIGKKKADLMKEVRDKFIIGCVNNGYTEDKANEIFDIVEKSNRYSFNKSHGVSYAIMAYWSAYMKKHYPILFYKNWLMTAHEKLDPDVELKQLIMSAKADMVSVKGPHYSSPEANFHFDEASQSIRYGICKIKHIGNGHLEKWIELTKGIKLNWINILLLISHKMNKRAIENMISVGALSGLNKTRTAMLHEFSCLQQLTNKEIEWLSDKIEEGQTFEYHIEKLLSGGTKSNGGGISTESRIEKVRSVLTRLRNPGRSLNDSPAIYSKLEENLLGCSMYHSELDACVNASYADTQCLEIQNGKLSTSVIACVVKRCRIFKTKNSDEMAFLTVEDDTAELDNIVIFPAIYEQFKDIIYDNATLLIRGEIKDKKRGSFIVETIDLI